MSGLWHRVTNFAWKGIVGTGFIATILAGTYVTMAAYETYKRAMERKTRHQSMEGVLPRPPRVKPLEETESPEDTTVRQDVMLVEQRLQAKATATAATKDKHSL